MIGYEESDCEKPINDISSMFFSFARLENLTKSYSWLCTLNLYHQF